MLLLLFSECSWGDAVCGDGGLRYGGGINAPFDDIGGPFLYNSLVLSRQLWLLKLLVLLPPLLDLYDSCKLSTLKFTDSRNELVFRSNELRTSAELNSKTGEICLAVVINGCITLASIFSMFLSMILAVGGLVMALADDVFDVDDKDGDGDDDEIDLWLSFMINSIESLAMPKGVISRESDFWLARDCNTGVDLSLSFVDCSFAFAHVCSFFGVSDFDLESSSFNWLAVGGVLSWSERCKMNWTSFEYSPHFDRICLTIEIQSELCTQRTDGADHIQLTFNGFSFGAINRSLLRHLSINVNRPILPVACANAKTTSWNGIFDFVNYQSNWSLLNRSPDMWSSRSHRKLFVVSLRPKLSIPC